MEGIELVCFKMISALGAAKSSFMEAVQEARLGHFEEARRCIEEGDKYHAEGHEAHFGLLQQETPVSRCNYLSYWSMLKTS